MTARIPDIEVCSLFEKGACVCIAEAGKLLHWVGRGVLVVFILPFHNSFGLD